MLFYSSGSIENVKKKDAYQNTPLHIATRKYYERAIANNFEHDSTKQAGMLTSFEDYEGDQLLGIILKLAEMSPNIFLSKDYQNKKGETPCKVNKSLQILYIYIIDIVLITLSLRHKYL